MPNPIHREEALALRWLLRELRVAAGMKQAELSAAIGKPQPWISAIETGIHRLDVVELRDICGVLGVSLVDFVQRYEAALAEPEKPTALRRVRVDVDKK